MEAIKELKLSVELKHRLTEVILKSKVTFIQGRSGTGKTTLIEDLDNEEALITFPYPVIVVNKIRKRYDAYFDDIYHTDGIVLIAIDEDFSKLRDPEFQKAILDSKHLFLIVSRDPIVGIPYSYKDVLILTKAKDSTKKKLHNIGVQKYRLSDGMDTAHKVRDKD